MVARRICQIPVADLKTIRISIKGIATEMPLDRELAGSFFGHELAAQRISPGACTVIESLVACLAEAQKVVSGDLSIEFVIPADEK